MNAQQLKNSILQMAVSGKLVPQDPNDEPASVLLERIRKEKERLIKEGKMKKEKNPSYIFRGADNTPYEKVGKNEPVSIADEVPFEIPESWEWARASSLGQMVRGKGIKRAETISEGMPCVRYGEIYTTYNTSFTNTKSFIPQQLYSQCNLFHTGDLIFTLTGENKPDIAKAVAYLGESPVAAGGDLAYWTYHKMNPLYLAYFMASPYCIEQKRRLATGDIIVHISTDKVGSFLVPVPPKAEQDRIVAKLQEIEPLLQEYDRNEQKVHLELKLFPEQFKKSILQMAVQGKLVPQDPDDEPASVLLERIRTEKERLIKEGKIKRDKNESVIYKRDNSHYEKLGDIERCIDDELPFEVPESWAWVHVGDIFLHNTGKAMNSSAKQNDSSGQIRPFITTSNVYWNSFDFSNVKEMFFTTEEYKRCSAIKNDILICEGGAYYGRTAIWKYDYDICFQNHVHRLRSFLPLVPEFFYYMFRFYRETGLIQSKGTAMPGLSSKVLHELRIPLPPLPEQIRIVSQIEAILPMVKSL